MTQEAKNWKLEAQWLLKGKRILVCPVEVFITFYLKRDRDVDNLKLLVDSLEDTVIKNDSQIKVLHIFKEMDKNNPRVEVVIDRLE